jgi:cytochrome c peroxidase
VFESARYYDPVAAGVDVDLTHRLGPIEPVLRRLDPALRHPIELDETAFRDMVSFVRDALLDPRARKENLCGLVPRTVPSGMPVLQFEGCP